MSFQFKIWVGLSAIVLGIVMSPYFHTSRTDPRGSPTVKVEMRSLSAALAQYRAEYDHLPALDGDDFRVVNQKVMSVLMCSGPDETMVLWNPNKIRFFHVAQTRLSNGVFCDPWRRPYHFAYATNLAASRPGNDCSSGIAIWSVGRNGKDELGAGDDVLACVSDR